MFLCSALIGEAYLLILSQVATTALLKEIVQRIAFGDLLNVPETPMEDGLQSIRLPMVSIESMPEDVDAASDTPLPEEAEDSILKHSNDHVTDWVAAFVRRVILLLENLPEDGSEGITILLCSNVDNKLKAPISDDLVSSVCAVLCNIVLHASETLYDMVLKLVFDYVSSSIAPGALFAVSELVECVSAGNIEKALAKFFPFAANNIILELKRGASSIRTTSVDSTPVLSDSTLHWSESSFSPFTYGAHTLMVDLAILRGVLSW